MSFRQLPAILLLNIFGIGLFLSWYLPENHGFWYPIDSTIFYYFNAHLADNSGFLKLVAITNNRAFDGVSLLAMGILFLHFFLKQDATGKRRMIIMGVVMLLTAVILNQSGRLFPIERPSPTLTFSGINRVSELTGIPTKDASRDSFPGDHGLMLMIFAGFMLRYFTRWSFCIAVVYVVVFSLPRIMIGSHWFTDIYVGALSMVCIVLSWWLLTPACDAVIDGINRLIPGKHRPVK
ncbi:phosphatase PAP2 family protein [Pragia fontium]|uniref:Lipid A 1-diphosphate synthase n=2 Tax=Pragia fontium TaxID=82985 RepID=A0AAJ4WB24_9GAMM|nr:phosphatase PAP2 family protein [Pragia fontium]AKJ42687.1 membrane protein [Pragia fontium]SFC91350.1 Membrane-associated phospholipid phosphatase [Pragia fontium DSM 5563 = ATCC 49100]SUB83037.1 Inner membrane protein yeiU [Pragia fontium]VEJ55936.1 Inner membrane protein yeiU [Pragia fontium]